MTTIIEELRSGPHRCPICSFVHTMAATVNSELVVAPEPHDSQEER